MGNIDILINNAGVAFGTEPAYQANLDEWEQCIKVNINGLVYCTHAVLPGMVHRNRGHIVNLGSIVGGTEFSIVRFRGDKEKAKALYDKTKSLQPEDIAKVIDFCVSLPPHVNINTLELMPVAQAFAPLAIHRT